jgi:hypothetical protein
MKMKNRWLSTLDLRVPPQKQSSGMVRRLRNTPLLTVAADNSAGKTLTKGLKSISETKRILSP